MGFKNLLVIGLVVWVGLMLWRRWQAATRRPRDNAYGGRMVRCEECGVYLPAADAVQRRPDHYTCTSHPPQPRA